MMSNLKFEFYGIEEVKKKKKSLRRNPLKKMDVCSCISKISSPLSKHLPNCKITL